MNKIYMYAHGGSGNHGCEAIVRSTCNMLDGEKILISERPEEDAYYEIGQFCQIKKDKIPYSKKSVSFIKAYLSLKMKHDYIPLDQLNYKKTIDLIQNDDIALSIGGDNYCYADVDKYIMLHDMMIGRKAKTVLWGCSIEPALLNNPKISEDLKKYDLITARETITYHALKAVNANVELVTDPAFTLPPLITKIPDRFISGNMVGINISPMIQNNEKQDGITLKNYEKLIEFILEYTDMGIALIPHVIWENNDDRIPLLTLYKKYKDCGRVVLIEDQNCSKLKYIISKCRFFIGARTHATIAAYSSCIPTLVIGYSVKARGIARDLFGNEENYILPVQELRSNRDLIDKFQWILQNEKEIKKQLEIKMPEVLEESLSAESYLRRMILRGV